MRFLLGFTGCPTILQNYTARLFRSCANSRFRAYVRTTPALNRVYVHEWKSRPVFSCTYSPPDSHFPQRSRSSSVSKAKAKPGPKSAKVKPGPASRSRRTATPDDDDVNGDDETDDDPFKANDEEDPLDVTPLKQK